ncbi:hypothetical protein NFJ02_32g82070 [Pycnococcus provasolii]
MSHVHVLIFTAVLMSSDSACVTPSECRPFDCFVIVGGYVRYVLLLLADAGWTVLASLPPAAAYTDDFFDAGDDEDVFVDADDGEAGGVCLADSDDEDGGGLVGPCFDNRDEPPPPQAQGTSAAKKPSRHDVEWKETSKVTVKPTDFAGPPPGPTKRSCVRKNASDPEVDPMTCFREFCTIEMEDFVYSESLLYVKHLQVIDKPNYVHDKLLWPPKWMSEFLKAGNHTRKFFNRWLSAITGLAGHGEAGGGGGPHQWWSDDWNVNKQLSSALTEAAHLRSP